MNLQLKGCLAAVAAGVLSLSAHAGTVTFDTVGDHHSFTYAASVDGASLFATVTYTLLSATGKTATFDVTAVNSSTGVSKGAIPNRMVAFGIALVNPDLDKANVAGLGEWDASINQVFPGGTLVDLCEYSGSNCLDDTGKGVQQGATDEFTLTLKFLSNVGQNPISFSSPFESKWQGVGNDRLMYALTGCSETDTGCTSQVSQLPEPTSLALGGLALLGAFAARRRSVA